MLAKTQNSFNNEEEFTLVRFAPLESEAVNSGASAKQVGTGTSTESELFSPLMKEGAAANKPFDSTREQKPDFFVLPSNLWSSIQSDKTFADEIQKVIAREVEKKAAKAIELKEAEFQSVVAQRISEKEIEGFEAGIKRAEAEMQRFKAESLKLAEEVKQDLQQSIQNVIQEKQRLLEQHQQVWTDALSMLMKKFLIKNAGSIETSIGSWLQTQVANFSATERYKISIPESQYKRMEGVGLSSSSEGFEFIQDKQLQDGEFRVEAKSGGVFFSVNEEMKKLEELLSQIQSEAL